ncbi:MAG: Holliday junction resolvase RuvX [Clostridiaceae bacterium]|nr:Holliday junction resolvase RuvX [Clostridiaceae bacterium]
MYPVKRVLGLDYGERRIGVAVSDPLRILARRLTTIDRTSDSLEDAAAEVARLCEEQDADTVIIGCPMRTDGRFSEMEAQVEKFADAVRESTGCQVELFDERYTSILASRVVRETSGGGRRNRPWRSDRDRKRDQKPKDKALVDRIAAEILLQDWLDVQRR